jgi:hypothetical protein
VGERQLGTRSAWISGSTLVPVSDPVNHGMDGIVFGLRLLYS